MQLSEFKKILKKPWFKQVGNAHPLFIQSGALSGFLLERELGYSGFYFWHKDGQAEMNYLESDLERIWRAIFKKCAQNASWLKKQRSLYTKKFNEFSYEIKNQEKIDYKRLSDSLLLRIFKKAVWVQCFSVGLGHYCEAIGTRVARALEKELIKSNHIKIENDISQRLLSPVNESFISKEERELHKINQLSKEARVVALRRHWRKYFWINNSYLGQGRADMSFFLKRLKAMKKDELRTVLSRKVVKNIKLTKKAKIIVAISEITHIWQDLRKANILKAIGLLDKITHEVAQRMDIPFSEIVNLTPLEILSLKNVFDIKKYARLLKERSGGAYYFLTNLNSEIVVSGKKAKSLQAFDEELNKVLNISSVNGQTAQPGYAKGRAVICKYIFEMKKVRQGDILVTAMTRPEFMPIIKKAAAIVTDEGGITSHAAIISRELKTPCVIGTKIATKVFKDGDLVEVNANKGVVKKL